MGDARPLRILWLVKGLGPGGMERLLLTQARLSERDAFDYSVAYLVERPDSLRSHLEEEGVRCVDIGRDALLDPRWIGRLRSFVRAEGINVVHMQSPAVAAAARPALRLLRGRPALVYTEHNSWADYRAPTRLANLVTYPLDDAQFAVSRAARDSAPGFLRRRVRHLPQGIDVAAVRAASSARAQSRGELGCTDDEVVVGVVANLREQKNLPLMLDVARRVVDRDPRVRFVSLGHGPLRHELEARRDELGLGERFRFLGHVTDAPRTMAAFDVFALSSDHEGMPVSVMEAFALGLPLVVTAVGGLPDVVDDVVGRLVPPRRADLLADAILELTTDPVLRVELGHGSARRAEDWDAASVVREVEQVYREVAR